MKNYYKRAFTLVELLVVVTVMIILFLISVSIGDRYKEKTYNTKVITDLIVTDNTLRYYYQETKTLPISSGNTKFYKQDGTYAHDEKEAYGLNGFFTETTLPKRFINIIPLDPRTNHYYAYGKTIKGNNFEISGIISLNGNYESVVNGNYEYKDMGTYNLIKEYNGPKFVYNKSKKEFPYNPQELILSAKLYVSSGVLNLNGNNITNNEIIFKTGDIIELSAGGNAILYASDGSEIHLGNPNYKTIIKLSKMKYKKENNLFSDIRIALKQGSILTKAPKMGINSNYDTYTEDIEASVRGTIYSMTKIPGKKTKIEVIKGEVIIYKIGETYNSLVYKLDDDKDINKLMVSQETANSYELIGDLVIENIAGEKLSILKENSSISIDSDKSENIEANSGTTHTDEEDSLEIICNDGEHLQGEKCVSNTKTGTCSGEIPQNSLAGSNLFNQTWDSTQNKYLPETKNWGFSQEECKLTCVDGYEFKDGKCSIINNNCSGEIPTNGVSNASNKSGIAWNYSINSGDCTFVCKPNYTWNTSTLECDADIKQVNCTGLPKNAIWNSISSITQTWNGVEWLPTSIAKYSLTQSTTECKFKCNIDYEWDSVREICKPKNITATCGGTLPSNAYRISGLSYTQTWNGTAYVPILAWKYYVYQSQCSYNCNPGFHFEQENCLSNTKSCSKQYGNGYMTWRNGKRLDCIIYRVKSPYLLIAGKVYKCDKGKYNNATGKCEERKSGCNCNKIRTRRIGSCKFGLGNRYEYTCPGGIGRCGYENKNGLNCNRIVPENRILQTSPKRVN